MNNNYLNDFNNYNPYDDIYNINQEEVINFPNNVKVTKIFPCQNPEIPVINNDNNINNIYSDINLSNENFSNNNLSNNELTTHDLSTVYSLGNNNYLVQNNLIDIPNTNLKIQLNNITNDNNNNKENNDYNKNNDNEENNKNNQNIALYNIDNQINFSIKSKPKFDFSGIKTKLKYPEESKQNNSLINGAYKSETIKPYKKKFLSKTKKPEAINYCNNLEFKELEDFNPDLWKKICREDADFFNYDKGNVIDTQMTSVNDSNEEETYIGEINQKGEKNGMGKLISPSKKRIGTWRENKFTGWGREIREGGEMYEGKYL